MHSFKILCLLALIFGALNKNVESQDIIPVLLVHGGAGDVSDESIPPKIKGIKLAARIGYETLKSSGSVLEAVQKAVETMEEDINFNSGNGSVLNWEGDVQMDAAIMDGKELNAGCVSLVRDILHPISLARSVMDKTHHKYMAGEGVMAFAKYNQFEILEPGALVTEKSLKALEDYKNSLNTSMAWSKNTIFGSPGTVGAVAIDAQGNMAAATSTGGITGKMPGRIGDSPILGGGTYADNDAGCISATGSGETIMRYNVASRILALMQYYDMSAQDATAQVLEEMTRRFEQTAGVISIDRKGNLGIYFTSKRMTWAYQRGGELHYGIEQNEDNMEIVGEPRVKA